MSDGRIKRQAAARMVSEWWELGMVLPVETPPAHLPPDIRVEQGRHIRGLPGQI
jgi:hypothetical protein